MGSPSTYYTVKPPCLVAKSPKFPCNDCFYWSKSNTDNPLEPFYTLVSSMCNNFALYRLHCIWGSLVICKNYCYKTSTGVTIITLFSHFSTDFNKTGIGINIMHSERGIVFL